MEWYARDSQISLALSAKLVILSYNFVCLFLIYTYSIMFILQNDVRMTGFFFRLSSRRQVGITLVHTKDERLKSFNVRTRARGGWVVAPPQVRELHTRRVNGSTRHTFYTISHSVIRSVECILYSLQHASRVPAWITTLVRITRCHCALIYFVQRTLMSLNKANEIILRYKYSTEIDSLSDKEKYIQLGKWRQILHKYIT